ncbi:arginine metabolism regulation II [Fusarium albosuccineum]|uniref:Arginine metabolism regulation II n=1 Tax=Fusarium albosuccineum TaxID=1237068 RepID=A0A8H4LQA0_9HYPO|nr:arginine metabolism regulation II [Fusarium albosuccineum]
MQHRDCSQKALTRTTVKPIRTRETVESRDIDSPLSYIHLEDSQGKSDLTLRFLYGVSETWLSLVSQTTRLANFMERLAGSKERFDGSSLDSLESHKKRLENLVWALAQSTPPPQIEEVSKYTPRDHLVRALNYALVIFFYRRIRDVNPSILQQHVDNVIQALREFDAACERDGIDGPGSPWPVFLAGCEAMHTSQRQYFSDWLQNSFDKTGFTRFRTIISCMHEVWRRQVEGMGIGQPNGTWVQVCQEQDLYVMLC